MVRPESQAIVPIIEEAVVRQDVLPMNLLVVDDEQYVRQLCADVATQMEDEGFEVDVQLDGREARQQADRESYGLVICDMKMPGLDGQHFYQALAQAGNPLSKRFLFVTGDIVAQHTRQFLDTTNCRTWPSLFAWRN
jgi:DNA-binding response OmpR family regulator